MRHRSSTLVLAAAGVTLVAGGCWALVIATSAPSANAGDLEAMRALAGRLESQPAASGNSWSWETARESSYVPFGVAPAVAVPQPPKPAPTPVRWPAPRIGSAERVSALPTSVPVLPAPSARRSASAPERPARSERPKSIALAGVMRSNAGAEAVLVDLSSHRRETLRVGERAFGVTLAEVGEETATIHRDGEELVLRMGESPLLLASAAGAATPAIVTTGGGATEGGFGPFGAAPGASRPGRGARAGGFDGSARAFRGGGGGGQPRATTGQAAGLGASGRRGRTGGANASGGAFGGGGGFGGASSMNRAGAGGAGAGRGFGGGGSGARGGFPGGGSGTSAFSSSGTPAASSNPQTARRTGSRLSGGESEPLESPEPISNPQTMRRTGASANSGAPAFGEGNGSPGLGSFGGTATGRRGSGSAR